MDDFESFCIEGYCFSGLYCQDKAETNGYPSAEYPLES